MQDTRAWTTYYTNLNTTLFDANVALKEGLFRPDKPIVTYGAEETYMGMPSTLEGELEHVERSPWGMCMALISQGSMSLPLVPTKDGNWMPAGADDLRNVDLLNPDAVAAFVRNITAAAMGSVAGVWHKGRRHAPSVSGVCNKEQDPTLIPRQAKLDFQVNACSVI